MATDRSTQRRYTVDETTLHRVITDQTSDFTWLEYFAASFSILGLLSSIASTLSYNLIVAGLLTQSVVFGMAELCSSMPTAGGLYYASACVGWSNFLGFSTGPCSVNYALAAMILAAAEIVNPDYGCLAMNSTKILGYINLIGTVLNLLVVVIFIIWLPVGTIQDPKYNGTKWPIGWSFIMGFLSVIWTMSGYDTPFHLSEECSNANIAGPRAIVFTGQLGLYLGFAIILAIAYTVKDVKDVVAGAYRQPMASLCVQVLGKNPGLAICTIASSRVVFAYSRDGAIPGSKCVWFVLTIGALLGLLMFASPVAIGVVFSLDKFRPGPCNFGCWSKPIVTTAVAWWLLIIPALCFPAVKGKDLNDLTMNYTYLIYGGTMLFALVYYAIGVHKWFRGPRVNVEHLIHSEGTESAGSRTDTADHFT
ncbi:amino acid transporter-like protein [Hyaloscypha variabilis]